MGTPYNPPIDILFVCTGNVCRSPMAEGLLRSRLDERGVAATVTSTGTWQSGRPASEHSVTCMLNRGIDIADHRSRVIDREQLRRADLVLGMARSHVREASILEPAAFARTFTLKELVRRGEATGPRSGDETVAEWLDRTGRGRRPTDHLGQSAEDDVADPIGFGIDAYEGTALELEDLVDRLIALLWPEDLIAAGAAGAGRAEPTEGPA